VPEKHLKGRDITQSIGYRPPSTWYILYCAGVNFCYRLAESRSKLRVSGPCPYSNCRGWSARVLCTVQRPAAPLRMPMIRPTAPSTVSTTLTATWNSICTAVAPPLDLVHGDTIAHGAARCNPSKLSMPDDISAMRAIKSDGCWERHGRDIAHPIGYRPLSTWYILRQRARNVP
jgi:hypothetical protein